MFRRQAEQFAASGSPVYAHLARRCATEPLVDELVDHLRWDVPLRLFGGVHYLELAGVEPYALSGDWPDFRSALESQRDFLARFVREQAVQTNEVQRCYGLLPAFLELARSSGARTVDLVELGPSAGLNLLWDRYAYAYRAGRWGSSELLLGGVEYEPVPREVLSRRVGVRRRVGIDLKPVDVTTDHGARLLHAFLWPGRVERAQRLRTAIRILRREPPALVRGDYVELLPSVLAERDEEALTVVFQTASTGYIGPERRAQLRELLEAAGRDGPLGWISTRAVEELEEDRDDSYELEIAHWPDGRRRLLLRCDFHGSWLRWRR
ncbi:MAG TPA: DUF2332 domain-containing protein [Gaiellaceae bacterium]|nr:DUF2332 domain-containing protein [Gaiellaceae bacterium]